VANQAGHACLSLREEPETVHRNEDARAADEELVWLDCQQFIFDPGATLAEAQRQLRERLSQVARRESDVRELELQIANKELGRERAKTLYRREQAGLDETEAELGSIHRWRPID
jgi:hypothetical protein